MFAGFDYGTSNCAFGTFRANNFELIPLDSNGVFMPSTLYALDRNLIVEAVYVNMTDANERQQFLHERSRELHMAEQTRQQLDIKTEERSWFMGAAAINNYIRSPEEGWYVKSPKSYLGATGLRDAQHTFIGDVVALMMQNVKFLAQQQTGENYDQVVIGRPIHFQGISAEASDSQAIKLLTQAARYAGFKSVEFFYEPLAAGIDFETTLTEDKTVLVVDIGGGTTDCSLLRMGPSYRDKFDRNADFLGHSGMRIGGNDLDISLNFLELMLCLGRGTALKNGLPVPAQYYMNAAKINDINAQSTFYSRQYVDEIAQLLQSAKKSDMVARLQMLQTYRMTHQLAQSAEQCKIALSNSASTYVDLDYIEVALGRDLSVEAFEMAIEKPLRQIAELVSETLKQAHARPDIVYLTGGSGKSPSVQNAIAAQLGDIPVASGDYFGSVAVGLAKWAKKIFA